MPSDFCVEDFGYGYIESAVTAEKASYLHLVPFSFEIDKESFDRAVSQGFLFGFTIGDKD
jgi:hypothetical protein